MAEPLPAPREYDAAMVHHFIRLVGRTPTEEELVRFEKLHSQLAQRRAPRTRRRTARLLARL